MTLTDQTKEIFVLKTKLEIKDLSDFEACEYDVNLKKYEYDQSRIKLRQIKQDVGKTRKSDETRQLILWGRMVQTEIKENPNRKTSYLQLEQWMDKFLIKDADRKLCGFPPKNNDN